LLLRLLVSPLLGNLLITILGQQPLLLFGSLLTVLMLLGGDLLHVGLLLGSLRLSLSCHLLHGSQVLLLAMQHLKKLLLSLPRGCCALQIKT
jgi:hypothetical protein